MKQRGVTLIELLVIIAILGVIAAVVALNVSGFFGTGGNETTTGNLTGITYETWRDLRAEPISSLNMSDLQLVVDYSCLHGHSDWAMVYQNQIIINELQLSNISER